MSKPIKGFIPVAKGNFDAQGATRGEQIVLWNISPYTIMLTFPDGSYDFIPAFWNRSFVLEGIPLGIINYSVINTLPLSSSLLNYCYGILYEPGEHVPYVNSPIPLTSVNSVFGTSFFTNASYASPNANGHEHVSIYNPSNSGVNLEIVHLEAFTTDTTLPFLSAGFEITDPNYSNNTGVGSFEYYLPNTIPSITHATFGDDNFFATINQYSMVKPIIANVQNELISYPQSITVPPGAGFVAEINMNLLNKYAAFFTIWSEIVIPV